MRTLLIGIMVSATVIACAATTPGAQPHDMSAASHEAAANEHEKDARLHAADYNPDAGVTSEHCSRGTKNNDGGVCWTSVSNPTQEHRDAAEKHHKMATDHRAASQALRDAEARACVGLSEQDREMSPFEHKDDIAAVEPLQVTNNNARVGGARTVGATVTFRAVPGMTAEWLQRVVDCHAARNAAIGHVVPEMPTCPLVPNGVSAKVTSTGAGFAVAIQSDDADTSREVLRRAMLLK